MTPRAAALWIGLSILLPFASSAKAAPPAADAPDEKMEACSRQLAAVGEALRKYEKEHGKLPGQLSDLHPKYLADKAAFHCPADPSPEGTPGRSFAHRDPKLPMSYSYEFSADPSRGLPSPLGPFPRPDVGDAWGTCRHVMTKQADFFGDQVPAVRCFHHKEENSDAPRVINLTRGGRQYRSNGTWEDHPDSVAQVLERAGRALADPDAKAFGANWHAGPLENYLEDKPFDRAYDALRPQFVAFAGRAASAAESAGEDGPRRSLLRLAATCYGGVGETDKALACMDRSMAVALAAGEYRPGNANWGAFGSERDLFNLARIYRAGGRHGTAAGLLAGMNAARPRVGTYMGWLAEVHDAAGKKDVAEKWRDQASPARLLVSQPAPEFSLPAHGGGTLGLGDVLKGRKALLVNFWFYGCGPCHAEAPHLQKLYAEMKDKGLEIVAVNLGDTPQSVQKFIDQHKLTFKVVMGGDAEEGQRSVFSDYRVTAYPTSFLVDADGKVVWVMTGFEEESMETLRGELRKLGVR